MPVSTTVTFAPGLFYSCRGKTLKILESNPFQIVLCLLVLLDAGVVVAEILLDLHAIRSERFGSCLANSKYIYSILILTIHSMGLIVVHLTDDRAKHRDSHTLST